MTSQRSNVECILWPDVLANRKYDCAAYELAFYVFALSPVSLFSYLIGCLEYLLLCYSNGHVDVTSYLSLYVCDYAFKIR